MANSDRPASLARCVCGRCGDDIGTEKARSMPDGSVMHAACFDQERQTWKYFCDESDPRSMELYDRLCTCFLNRQIDLGYVPCEETSLVIDDPNDPFGMRDVFGVENIAAEIDRVQRKAKEGA